LFSGSTILGTVLGSNEAPVAGAQVRAEPRDPAPFTSARPTSTRATDENGGFELPGVQPGSYNVWVRHADFAPAVVPEVRVAAEAETEVNAVLHRGARVVGRLLDAEERPLRGRVTLQELSGEPVSRLFIDLLVVETAPDGSFQLERIPPGSHALGANAPGYVPERVEVSLGERESRVDVGEVRLASGLAIRGRALDAAGLPLVGASLAAYPMRRGMYSAFQGIEAVSETDGSFALGGLSQGQYRIHVRALGYGSRDLEGVEAGTERLEVVLKPAGSIRGVAVDDQGKPLEAFHAFARLSAERMGASGGADTVTSEDGSFTLEVGEGTYILQVQAPGRVTGVVSDVKVIAGQVTGVGRIVLRKGGSVRGFVVDGSGLPVSGAKVLVLGPGRDSMSFLDDANSALSDNEGFFEIQGLPDGPVDTVARHPLYAEGRASGLNVDSRSGPAEARIVLTQGGRLEGLVRLRDPEALANVSINVVPGGMGEMGWADRKSANPGSDGYFYFEALPAGTATVMLMRSERTGTTLASIGSTRKTVEIREGETSQIEFNLNQVLVQGQVLRAGAPASGHVVTLISSGSFMTVSLTSTGPGMPAVPTPRSGPQPLRGETGEDGRYELLVESPGPYSVRVQTLDGKTSLPSRQVEIPDTDVYTLDLVFSGARVTGTVIDKESDEPVGGASVSAVPKRSSPAAFPSGPEGVGGAAAGPDGRFELELEPGEYSLSAFLEDYVGERINLKVGASGASGVRLLVSPSLTIRGSVRDGSGRGVPGLSVWAAAQDISAEPGINPPGSTSSAQTLADGSFVLDRLAARRYNLLVNSRLGGFALKPGVRPGKQEVELRLEPGGRVLLQVRGPEGLPVEGAFARLLSVNGFKVWAYFGEYTTSAEGTVEVPLPAGSVEIEISKEKLKGEATVQVSPGATVPAEVALHLTQGRARKSVSR
jgi:hypothetical protein